MTETDRTRKFIKMLVDLDGDSIDSKIMRGRLNLTDIIQMAKQCWELEIEPMQKFYFTFGHDHRNPATGRSLNGHYVVVEAWDNTTARAEVWKRVRNGWSTVYDEKRWQTTGVIWNWKQLPLDDFPVVKQYEDEWNEITGLKANHA